jgi:predicted naringenin-chalcone synthase
VNTVSPCLSFFFGASTLAAFIFAAPTYKVTIISLEPCALMLIFSISFPDLIKFPYFMDTPERRVWAKGGSKTG